MSTLDHEPYQVQRISKEELEKQILRLTRRPEPAAAPPANPQCATRTMTKDELEKMKERLYTQSMQLKEQKRKQMEEEQTREQLKATATVSSDELKGIVGRVYTEALARKAANLEEGKKQYLFHPPESKKIPLKAFVHHMYDEGIEKGKEREKKLYDKYLAPTEIHTGTISPIQAAESAARLSTKK
ncbi:hypothetical protein STCU_02677 [Strigomonas culicis]|uniref:Uncharacterized protein n=1 Tax=Strigomonas culicis TaxID=28005 RepID=S9WA23_9TRYP|nr:hypothetical protein STCU_02677 [Strigomonas culicis]|eukprot:EPY32760.1 hypothetical protein STCU_02677 [Strigomonas culicis]